MNRNLLFDFSVNKENKTIHVQREFAANKELVWNAWTTPELLDQWWAPKPYKTETQSMDFREGGFWFYAMVSPENEKHWCRFDYETINIQESYSGQDAFCDETGAINANFPRMTWNNTFSEANDSTKVDVLVSFDDLADLEKVIEMGFKEGFTAAMGNLDELLEQHVLS